MNHKIKQALINFVEYLPTVLCDFAFSMLWANLLITSANVVFKTEFLVTLMTCFYGAIIIMFINETADRASAIYEVVEESK